MQLSQACSAILKQLSDLVGQLSDREFTQPSATLNQSTIGQHLRHTLEFFICLEHGCEKGVVNYDQRQHDKLIESDRFIALNTIARIQDFIATKNADVPLQLEVGYNTHNHDCVRVSTNYWRELTYNIEHAVHHMAIMKIGVNEIAQHVRLPKDFGVAVSTLRYQQQEALTSTHR
ncbi:MAG: DinB family protein [Flammeovirgaceae bacterium]